MTHKAEGFETVGIFDTMKCFFSPDLRCAGYFSAKNLPNENNFCIFLKVGTKFAMFLVHFSD